jgi:hypothetical protein
MATAIRPITEHRLQRLCLWLALVVARLAAPVLNAIARRALARQLNDYARIATLLLVARAIKRVAFKAPRLGVIPQESRRHTLRRVAGARLRRALRGCADRATLADRLSALCAVLAGAERWIAHLTRRLQHGLTKLRRLPSPCRVRLTALACAPAALCVAADTS